MEFMNERENERRREEERLRRENDQSQNYGYLGACCI